MGVMCVSFGSLDGGSEDRVVDVEKARIGFEHAELVERS